MKFSASGNLYNLNHSTSDQKMPGSYSCLISVTIIVVWGSSETGMLGNITYATQKCAVHGQAASVLGSVLEISCLVWWHVCNPSTLGGRDKRILSLSIAQATYQDPVSKNRLGM